jgi:hypothetical protein
MSAIFVEEAVLLQKIHAQATISNTAAYKINFFLAMFLK